MLDLSQEIRTFLRRKEGEGATAGQIAAFRLATGTDLDLTLDGDEQSRTRMAMRVRRLVERERLKGARHHWSYDLNRHIALKQALDRLECVDDGQAKNGNGASRRRSLSV